MKRKHRRYTVRNARIHEPTQRTRGTQHDVKASDSCEHLFRPIRIQHH